MAPITWLFLMIIDKLQAIRRRFDKRIYIPLPDLKARQHMFKVLKFFCKYVVLKVSCELSRLFSCLSCGFVM